MLIRWLTGRYSETSSIVVDLNTTLQQILIIKRCIAHHIVPDFSIAMSGIIEGAGLALAVLPILLSVAKHYDDCLSPFMRYKKFSKEAKCYHRQLEVQKAIYRNACLRLLEDVAEHGIASRMLSTPGDDAWLNQRLDGLIVKQLGNSKEACVAAVKLIEEKLQDIDEEHQKFKVILDQEKQVLTDGIGTNSPLEASPADYVQGSSVSVPRKSLKSRVAGKLSFSLKASKLEDNVAKLRQYNNDLNFISCQTRGLASNRPQLQRSSPREVHEEVERCGLIGKASQQVYSALGNACTKHTLHQAHCCVEVRQTPNDEENCSQFRFDMAFTHLSLAGSADKSDLLWFVVKSTIGDALVQGECNAISMLHGDLKRTLKRQIERDPTVFAKKAKKCVTSRMPTQATTPTSIPPSIPPPAPTESRSLDFEKIMRKDFCDILRRCYRESQQETACVCVLQDTPTFRNVVFPSPSALRTQRRQAISLGQVIASSSQGTVTRVPLYERIRLAKSLAVAVLQYHDTPWLGMSWRSEDVYFFGHPEEDATSRILTLTPHLNAKVEASDRQLSRAENCPNRTFVRNPLLFSLGIVLLEIAHFSGLQDLQQPSDLEKNQENQCTEFFVARRLAKQADTHMGHRYHSIVERLIECDFGCGSDLNDKKLQIAFYSEVIYPLENLEQDLRRLQLD